MNVRSKKASGTPGSTVEGARGPRDKGKETHSGASRNEIYRGSAPESEKDAIYTYGIPPTSTPSPGSPVSPPPSLDPPPYDFIHCKTRIDHNGPYHPEDVIAAIRATRGNFLEMSALLGRKRNAIRDYCYANIQVKDVLDEERESFVDKVEQMTHEIALQGDAPTLRFLLTTLGKDRGYSPKVEHTADDKPFVFEIHLADGTAAAMDRLDARQKAEQTIDKLLTDGIDFGGKP